MKTKRKSDILSRQTIDSTVLSPLPLPLGRCGLVRGRRSQLLAAPSRFDHFTVSLRERLSAWHLGTKTLSELWKSPLLHSNQSPQKKRRTRKWRGVTLRLSKKARTYVRKYVCEIARMIALKGINTGDATRLWLETADCLWLTGIGLAGASRFPTALETIAMGVLLSSGQSDGTRHPGSILRSEKIGLVTAVNEMVESLRLLLVIVTAKPMMNQLFPPKFQKMTDHRGAVSLPSCSSSEAFVKR